MVPYDRVSVVDLQTLFEVRFISFFSYSTSYIQLDVVINLYVGWLVTLIDKITTDNVDQLRTSLSPHQEIEDKQSFYYRYWGH